MYISLDWISEIINLKNIRINRLIKQLTLSGFEVENELEIKTNKPKNITLNITTTPNRFETLSIKGISKEILALFDLQLYKSKYVNYQNDWKKKILGSSNIKQNICKYSSFFSFTITRLSYFNSPNWLKTKLIYSGIIPFNNLLDFKNYILLETGYPLEFYDLDKIRFKLKSSIFNLNLKKNTQLQNFYDNNNQPYNLDKDIINLQANNLVLSIAGVIVNKNFCYTNDTKSLLVEVASFNSQLIREQSRKLGTKTLRSRRYEKKINDYSLLEAYYQFLNLVSVFNKNLVCKLHTGSYIEEKTSRELILIYQNVIQILGPLFNTVKLTTYLTPIEITNYLKKLGFTYKFDKDTYKWKIRISEFRKKDITREIDIIEEIARLHGYNKFLNQIPKIQKIGKYDLHYKLRKKITSILLNNGLNEVTTYSLSKQTITRNKFRLCNPLVENYSTLRNTLLPGLLEIVVNNKNQGNSMFELFEFGHIFESFKPVESVEREMISGIIGGSYVKSTWSQKIQSISWYEAKGKIENFYKKLNICVYYKKGVAFRYLQIYHPSQTAFVYTQRGYFIGHFGRIHPKLAKSFNLNTNLFLFEFDFRTILNIVKRKKLPVYIKYSIYPKISKDLSFIISEKFSFSDIKQTIEQIQLPYLIKIKLLDRYQGESIPDKYCGICIQLVFQSKQITLENKIIEKLLHKIKIELLEKYKIFIR